MTLGWWWIDRTRSNRALPTTALNFVSPTSDQVRNRVVSPYLAESWFRLGEVPLV